MNRLNTPAVMIARLVYAAHLIVALMGVTVILGAILHQNPRAWGWGCAALWLSFAGRFFLRRNRLLAACERSLNSWTGDFAVESPGMAEFEELLARREQLELRRGFADFDPWEILTLQHRIDECVRRYPELEPLLELSD